MGIEGVKLTDTVYTFGFPEQWAAFQEQHGKFLESFDALHETITHVTVRTYDPRCLADDTIFFLGSLVAEDFTEVWLLAGNGLGTGSMKVLRGMYERTVTAAYISKFPDQAEQFWKFKPIARRRLLKHARDLHGLPFVESVFGAGCIEECEEEYQKVRDDFKETLCANHSLTRDMPSWSKLSIPAMANKAGYGLQHCYYDGHAIPTQLIHSTVLSVRSRMNATVEEAVFDRQMVYAGQSVMTAHVVMLKMLRVQNAYFALGFDAEISQREAECKTAWPNVENLCGKGM